jgi:hypothetical protein
MPLEGIRTYLAEIRRVLRPGGRAICTFFAIGPSDTAPRFGGRDFVPVGGGVWTRRPEREHWALGHDEALVHELVTDAGCVVDDVIVGRWHHPLQPPADARARGADTFVIRANTEESRGI